MTMKQLMNAADAYVHQMTLWDVGLLKTCLCAMGVVLGTMVSARERKTVRAVAGVVFAVTYIPLMIRFITVMLEKLSCKNQ